MTPDRLGPYRVESVVGHGGMGSVYAAVNEATSERVAVKMLSPGFSDQAHFRERFEAEIETLKRLTHPNIVQIVGYGIEGDQIYYAMELVEGRSLFQELRDGRRFTPQETVRLGVQICSALRHAHDRGVIHRDLKPANLMLGPQQRIKLADFGIAKMFDGAHLTAAGGVIGTADYMSPEQAAGRPISVRSDIYSLGSVLYALLAGRPPFYAKTLPEVLRGLHGEEAPPLAEKAPSAPRSLTRLIHRLLEKDPEARIGTAQAVANRLQEIAAEIAQSPSDAKEPPPAPPIPNVDPDDDDYFELSEENDSSTRVPESAYSRPTAPIPPSPERETSDQPLAQQPTRRPPTDVQTSLRGGSQQDERETNVAPPPVAAVIATTVAPDPVETEHPQSQFTTIDEARQADDDESPPADAWRQYLVTGGLAILLIIVGVLGYIAVAPPSANTLYARITDAAKQGPEALMAARPQVESFLERFPEDARRNEVAEYAQEITLHETEKRQALRQYFEQESVTLTAAEKEYEAALALEETDPQAAMLRYQALIDVFGEDSKAPDATRVSVQLAERHLEQLAKKIAEEQPRYLESLEQRLATADKLHPTDQAAAEKIWQGLIVLYADKPWAKSVVQQAREKLAESRR